MTAHGNKPLAQEEVSKLISQFDFNNDGENRTWPNPCPKALSVSLKIAKKPSYVLVTGANSEDTGAI